MRPPPPDAPDDLQRALEVINAINRERVAAGIPGLVVSDALMAAARVPDNAGARAV